MANTDEHSPQNSQRRQRLLPDWPSLTALGSTQSPGWTAWLSTEGSPLPSLLWSANPAEAAGSSTEFRANEGSRNAYWAQNLAGVSLTTDR
jgi:hypothetical protein